MSLSKSNTMFAKRLIVFAAAALALAGATSFAQAPPNGVEATTTPISLPGGLAYDSNGNLYIAATNDNVIRMVNPAGIISTVAGTGDQGFAGDGGPATAALLDSPVGVALDSSNNLYIADSHNNRIRRVLASNGVISTIAGTGVSGFGGDAGPALAALLSYPTALAIDSAGNLYIADTNNNRIRKITGTTITTVAGNGEQIFSGDGGAATAAGLDSPNGVGVDTSFNIYIADTHNQRIREVLASNGTISTIAGTGVKGYGGDGGAGGSAILARPRGVSVESNGTILIADSDNDRIRTISGGSINTIAGNGTQGYGGDTGTATASSIDTPRAVGSNGTNVVFSDTDNFRVRQINGSGIIQTVAGVAPTGSESLTLSGNTTTVVYGTGSLLATFAFNSNTASGNVTFYDVTGTTPVQIGLPVPLSSNKATLSTTTLSAGTHAIEAVYPGDSNNAPTTSGVYVLVVSPLAITATANSATITYGNAIPTLTGTLNGVLAQDTANVTAVFTSTATGASIPGIYPISVSLTGSAAGNYTVTLTAAANLTISSPGFTFNLLLSTGAATQTVAPGGSATYGFTLTPAATIFPQAVTFTVTGLPTGATYVLTPASIAAGSGSTPMTLVITTVNPLAQLRANGGWLGFAAPLLLLPFAGFRRTRDVITQKRGRGRMLALVLLLAGMAVTLAGCAGGGFFGQTPQSYNIVVTATSGGVSHTQSVTLIVQ